MLVLDELVEAGPCLDALGRESHDLTLRPHNAWMHERPHPSSGTVRFLSVGRESRLREPSAGPMAARRELAEPSGAEGLN